MQLMNHSFQPVFEAAAACYTADQRLVRSLWEEIAGCYSRPARKYHNLQHLAAICHELLAVKQHIAGWNILVFSIAYHDIVYNTRRQDNEEKSAALAKDRLLTLDLPAPAIETCAAQILATKTHAATGDTDTAYFTDADLAILGSGWPVYATYASHIRQEYRHYPGLLYNPGRKKVLKKFLEKDRIYNTPHFYSLYEEQARKNMAAELANGLR
ncbi:MAG: hypothetical protein ABW019_05105 [Chitinophagaceae bacterium]